MVQPILETIGLCKDFGSVRVLFDMDFTLLPGEVHAVIGENGAGKSTLVKILSGYHQPSAGQILLNGQPISFHSTKEAEDAGICMIHQEFNLANDLTVEENIFLGREVCQGPFLDSRRMEQESNEVLASLETNVSTRTRVKDLSVSQKQMVEIAKAVSRNAGVLIMDEPTAVLTRSEINVLFRLIRQLKEAGTSIIYISHKLDEVKEIADTVTILRDGYRVSTRPVSELSEEEMASQMVGRELADLFPPKLKVSTTEPVLEVNEVTSPGYVHDCSFVLHKGEILGFAGLVGAGRTELMETIVGLREQSIGQVTIKGKPLLSHNYRDVINHGLVYLSEDRKGKGLLITHSMGFNLTLLALQHYAKALGLIDEKAEQASLVKAVEEFDIRAPSLHAVIATLSGGNQQKIALGKIMEVNPDILILDEPTRGIDIGTKQQVYTFIHNLAAKGKSIIVISSELPELIGLCPRVIVMREGRIVGEVTDSQVNEEEIMLYAMGLKNTTGSKEANHLDQPDSV